MSDNTQSPLDGDQINNEISQPKVFRQLFTPDECVQIVGLEEAQGFEESHIGGGTLSRSVDLYVRNSQRGVMKKTPETAWVYEKISDAVTYMNQYFRFEISEVEGIQIAQYPVGGHYNWHSDIGTGEASRRKLSLSVQLSDPANYSGGDLEFNTINLDNKQELVQQGAAIIFPSYLTHRVAVVTEGVRWSMVAWILGPPFR